MSFVEVLASGKALDVPMAEVYEVFDFDVNKLTSLEVYLREYFSRIMKKLKEIDYEKEKAK